MTYNVFGWVVKPCSTSTSGLSRVAKSGWNFHRYSCRLSSPLSNAHNYPYGR